MNLQQRLEGLRDEHGVVGAVAGVWHDGEVELAATGVCSLATGIGVGVDL